MTMAEVIFWLSALLLAYTFIGYPLLAAIRARLSGRAIERGAWQPRVSILVVAHNEAARIASRIENLLALDVDPSRLEIVVASDGSTDETAEIASRFRDRGVQCRNFSENRGKPAVLNELVPGLQGEIVVLADVRQRIAEDAIRQLVENFADPAVGAVSGELVLTGHDPGDEGLEGVGFYWRYEKFIRLRESRVDSTVGATGALYALRRDLFQPIPDDTLLDDVLIPMQVVRQGYRVLFEPAARASETLSADARTEFRRKTRTIAGNFQLFARNPWLFVPGLNRIWFATLSHKFCRLLGPLLLMLLLVTNLALMASPFYRVLMLLQLAFYLLAAITSLAPALGRRSPLLSVPHAFCLLNAATAVGFYRFVLGQQRVTWTRPR